MGGIVSQVVQEILFVFSICGAVVNHKLMSSGHMRFGLDPG